MDKATIRIDTPVKLGPKVYMPGEHEVDGETARELADAGLLVAMEPAAPEAKARQAPEAKDMQAPARAGKG